MQDALLVEMPLKFLQSTHKGHFNPSLVLSSVADVSIMSQLANLN